MYYSIFNISECGKCACIFLFWRTFMCTITDILAQMISTLKSKIVIVLKQHELAENWYKHIENVEQWDTCMLVMQIKLMKNIAFLKL